MVKKKEYSKEYIAVPAAWLERLVELSEQEGTNVQHMKGYIASAEVLIDNGRRIASPQDYKRK